MRGRSDGFCASHSTIDAIVITSSGVSPSASALAFLSAVQ